MQMSKSTDSLCFKIKITIMGLFDEKDAEIPYTQWSNHHHHVMTIQSDDYKH